MLTFFVFFFFTSKKKKKSKKLTLSERWEKSSPTGVVARKILDHSSKFGELLARTTSDEVRSHEFKTVWENYSKLMQVAIKYKPTQDECATFGDAARDWGKLFVKCFGGALVTPYVHIFSVHVATFLEKYGSLGKFGNWAAEGLHSEVKYTVLNNSPRSGGGASNLGPAYYALKTRVLSEILGQEGLLVEPAKRAKRVTDPDEKEGGDL